MKAQKLQRLRSRKCRAKCHATKCYGAQRQIGRSAALRIESLEPRQMLDGNPIIHTHTPDGLVTEPVASILLDLSGPIVGTDARDAESYELLHLGVDRLPGGGDDQRLQILPKYVDGSTQIELATTSDFAGWTEIDYAFPSGILGTWNVADDGASVTQLDNGGATFFVSDFDPGNTQFVGRILVEEAAVDDDFVGVVFGFQQDPDTGKPDSYYLLSWKQTAQGEAEGGVRLAKVTGSGQLINPPDLWDLDDADPHIDVLLEGPAAGWQDQTEYEFQIGYDVTSGTIDILIRHATEDQVVWRVDGFVDPAPLGPGNVGFYNFSQPSVRYTTLDYTTSLPDGYYQLTATSGEPGLRDLLGNALDGDGDGTGGDNFVTTFGIDTVTPAVDVDLQTASDSGMLDNDNLTNGMAPVFDVTVNKIGRIEIDFDGDETVDVEQFLAAPGTYPFSAAYGADATYSVAVDFFPASGDPNPAQATLDVTLDTQRPTLEPGSGEADAPWTTYDLTFSESIDPSTLTSDDIALLDPVSDPVAIDAITGSDVAYTVSFPGQSVLGNYTLSVGPDIADEAGNLMAAPAEQIVALNPDQFGPVVDAVAIQTDAITVTFFDASGMNAASVQSTANYKLCVSGGDGSFDEGNEADLSDRIGPITFDPITGIATLSLSVPLGDERYELTVNGDTPDGVRDTWDNLLSGGNDVTLLTLNAQPASILVDLQAASDSGISPTDNITNVTTPSLDVTVNEAGRININYGPYGSDSLLATEAGTLAFTAPTLPDGTHLISATFTPAADSVRNRSLTLTVDTQSPTINAGSHTAQAPWRVRTVAFDGPIASSTFTGADVVLTGADATEITPLTVTPVGGGYDIDFGYQTVAGSYRFEIGPNIEDLAGNPMQAVFSELVVLAADVEAPYVAAFSV
ncbi:MAG TPA: Ig-like domain-containing protein, partial [Thermoguttaceae bacterium]|nr:Ig-like domain-containing protein [Thermoguttaceae bacterium]